MILGELLTNIICSKKTYFFKIDATQCQLSRNDARMLEDVSAKVDLMYDKITDPDYDYNNFIGELS